MYTAERNLGDGNFKVEISESEDPKANNALMIAAFSLTSEDSLLISLNPKRKEEILKEFDFDYALMS